VTRGLGRWLGGALHGACRHHSKYRGDRGVHSVQLRVGKRRWIFCTCKAVRWEKRLMSFGKDRTDGVRTLKLQLS
jgi:hypothetical protein